MIKETIEYDFWIEYILYSLSQLFKSKYTEEQSFFKHSLENLDYYRQLKQMNVEVEEESLFIRLKIKFQNLPLVQVIINKENHKLCRVYVSDNKQNLGSYFYINDDKIMDLINLPLKKQQEIFFNVEQIRKDEFSNCSLITNSINSYLTNLVIEKNQLNKTDISAKLFSTYYGVCLILESGKNKQIKKRYRFLKEEINDSADTDSKLQKLILNKITGFIRIIKPENKIKTNT